jgi:alkanesulfonate monooxygenase SsuD/methylene tetrahydromethanopterin reductase-like flavin-dependent oxidoreductase (luciferase family)
MDDLLFGLNVPTSAQPEYDPIGLAIEAERLGFDFVSANDHPCGTNPSSEVWTLLTWIAARTSRIHVASRVLGVPYRAPAMMAKMAETLDRLSGGRLILGLGGGAADDEFRAFGLGVPSPLQKVVGLEEAVRIVRGLWTEPEFTFEGQRYQTEGAEIEPKPQRHIPIWLGTFGPHALDVTGRLADGWIPSYELAPPDNVVGMRRRIDTAAVDSGRDPAEIVSVYNLVVRVETGATSTPALIAGTANDIVDRLVEFVRIGFGAFNFIARGPDEHEQRAMLANDVIPAVRAAARELSR